MIIRKFCQLTYFINQPPTWMNLSVSKLVLKITFFHYIMSTLLFYSWLRDSRFWKILTRTILEIPRVLHLINRYMFPHCVLDSSTYWQTLGSMLYLSDLWQLEDLLTYLISKYYYTYSTCSTFLFPGTSTSSTPTAGRKSNFSIKTTGSWWICNENKFSNPNFA